MCACRQKKSFFIEDILRDVSSKKCFKTFDESTKHLKCSRATKSFGASLQQRRNRETVAVSGPPSSNTAYATHHLEMANIPTASIAFANVFPTYAAIKCSSPWPAYTRLTPSSYLGEIPPSFQPSYRNETLFDTNQLFKNQAANTALLIQPSFNVPQTYGFLAGKNFSLTVLSYSNTCLEV